MQVDHSGFFFVSLSCLILAAFQCLSLLGLALVLRSHIKHSRTCLWIAKRFGFAAALFGALPVFLTKRFVAQVVLIFYRATIAAAQELRACGEVFPDAATASSFGITGDGECVGNFAYQRQSRRS